MRLLSDYFQLQTRQTTVRTEFRAGFTTFLTMSYILLVNPQILAAAGMPLEAVTVVTALAAALATMLMGFWANYPFALAPGMGLNAYFTYAVVVGMGVDWQVALGAVFIEGIIAIIISVTGIRTILVHAIPSGVKIATIAGIGMFLALIGLENAGLVVGDEATLVRLGDLGNPSTLIALAGVFIIAALMARGMQAAISIGILVGAVLLWALGLAAPPTALLAWPSLPETLGMLQIPPPSWELVGIVLAFLFADFFDTAGTLLGVGRAGGFSDSQGNIPRATEAFTADAIATTVGAVLGTSPVTTYVESASGVEAGGRTGLTAVFTALLFLLAVFFFPLLGAIPLVASAPALVVVGLAMLRGLADLDWQDPLMALPAAMTVVVMPFTYSIANGIAAGIFTYLTIALATGKAKTIHPLLFGLAAFLFVYYWLVL